MAVFQTDWDDVSAFVTRTRNTALISTSKASDLLDLQIGLGELQVGTVSGNTPGESTPGELSPGEILPPGYENDNGQDMDC